MLNIIYNFIFIPILYSIRFILLLTNKKYKLRERRCNELLHLIPEKSNKKRILFHSASMGEFEQAKPIIEIIKNELDIEVIASFYSPSGLENQLNYKYADYFVYLPFDSKNKIKAYFDKIKPEVCVIVRYEYWFNFIDQMSKLNIKSMLVAATIPNGTYHTGMFTRALYRSTINKVDTIYSNDQSSYDFYKSVYNNELIISSDTRFDRILEKVESSKLKPIISKSIFNDRFVIILGSSWAEDEELFLHKNILNDDRLLILFVPHEPTPFHLNSLIVNINKYSSSKIEESKLNYILLSELLENKTKSNKFKHIIVDSIGKLLSLYSIADAAYIGGGFGAGVHSVTEPAGYGLALATGPKMQNSPDAINLRDDGCLEIIKNTKHLENWIHNTLFKKEKRILIENKSRSYLIDRKGSSYIIANKIKSIM